MTPVLITAPVDLPVTLAEAKAHVRVDHAFEDSLLEDVYIRGAMSDLDGWSGQLGRCIMPQTWRVEAPCAGWLVLPMPDVTEAIATYDDSTTEVLPTTRVAAGWAVSLGQPATIDFTCAMAENELARARVIVLQLVATYWSNRASVSAMNLREVPTSTQALIQKLRWRPM